MISKKDGAKDLSKALYLHPSITSLALHNNDIGKDGCKSIATLVQTSPIMNYLALGGNQIGKAGVESLCSALVKNPVLTSLDIQSNNIKKKGADAIGKLINVNRSLTFLDISDNELTNYGAKTIFNFLKGNDKLTDLNISYNENGLPIARPGRKAIREILLENKKNSNSNTSPSTPIKKNQKSQNGGVRFGDQAIVYASTTTEPLNDLNPTSTKKKLRERGIANTKE